MTFSGLVRFVFLACALGTAAGLTACDSAPETPSGTSSTAGGTTVTRKTSELPPHMVAAVSSGKAPGSVSVHFELAAPPAVGISLPVRIAIVPHRKFSMVRALFSAPEGLQMSAGQQLQPQSNVSADQMITHQLTLQPTREGIFLVSVGVETDGEDGNITRSFSIPIIVATGTPPGAEQPSAGITEAGEAPPAGAPAG